MPETTIFLKDERINLGVLANEIKLVIGELPQLSEKNKDGNRTLTSWSKSDLTARIFPA